jgi:hypothetical protein
MIPTEAAEPKKNIFLIITRDKSILDPSSRAAKFVADISSVVPELHVIYVGSQQQPLRKIQPNTFLYTARFIPFFSFLTVYQVILSQLLWKRRFQPTVIISLGDEISIAQRCAKKYKRPLYVFHAYMRVVGKKGLPLHPLIDALPQRIFVPNAYVAKVIENHPRYKGSNIEVHVFAECIDVAHLQNFLESNRSEGDVSDRNKIFTVVSFPRNANIRCFKMIKAMSMEILKSITRFQFSVVVKKNQFLKARVLKYLLGLPIMLYKEGENSVHVFHTARMMLYFESSTVPYEPILYSFISGCPVLSSGDEYSKVILFNSGFEEYANLKRDGKIFGQAVTKFINDPYLYSKYKMNCIGFAKTAFGTDRNAYLNELKDVLQ